MTTLADLPVGAAFLLAARITSKDQSGLGLALYVADRIQQGTLQVAPDLTVTGALANPASQVQVTSIGRPFQVGDIVIIDNTQETMVVRAAWVSPDGFMWSNSPDRRAVYTTTGATKVGTATLD
jgi:hypothetical protein